MFVLNDNVISFLVLGRSSQFISEGPGTVYYQRRIKIAQLRTASPQAPALQDLAFHHLAALVVTTLAVPRIVFIPIRKGVRIQFAQPRRPLLLKTFQDRLLFSAMDVVKSRAAWSRRRCLNVAWILLSD